MPQTWAADSGTTTVGRSRDCKIRLSDSRVSRHHATITRGSDGYWICDTGSQHGTFVNGQLISGAGVPAPLGSIIRIGDTLLTLVEDVELYRAAPRRVSGSGLGLEGELLAGPALQTVWDQAVRLAPLRQPVLVLGESGSGKECIARLLHVSVRPKGPFVALNVAAIPEGLFEAELFGHERGAFTGASSSRLGAFREAAEGLLFLDEIGDLGLPMQSKLLRAIDLGVVRPLGARAEVSARPRLVAATSMDLAAAVQAERFRADLLYRISGAVIHVPPLRERPLDVLILAESILSQNAPSLTLSVEAAERLVLSTLPGNVRSLRSILIQAIQQATAMEVTEIGPEQIPVERVPRQVEGGLSEAAIRAAMQASGGVVSKAAQLLRVSRTTFYNNCRRLSIEPGGLLE